MQRHFCCKYYSDFRRRKGNKIFPACMCVQLKRCTLNLSAVRSEGGLQCVCEEVEKD